MSALAAVAIEGLHKVYHLDSVQVLGLDNVHVQIASNRLTVISGPSGSGKTTLLNMIGCIDRPDSGCVVIAGQDIGSLGDDALSDFRARHIGYIFQTFNLLPVLSAYENVEYPLLMAKIPAAERAGRVMALLEAVGLADKARHWPSQLSGGQRQRVAIARALAAQPALVLADEPTANLDSHTGAAILELMRQIQRERQVSFVISSHDAMVLEAADEEVRMRDGRVIEHRRMAGTQREAVQ